MVRNGIILSMKKALITGANSVFNQALLQKLVNMGFQVVAHYHRDNNLTKDLKKQFVEVEFVQADFTDETSFKSFYGHVIEKAPFDVIVNAAVLYKEADGDWRDRQSEWQSWADTFAANSIVPALLMANADKLLSARGVVVNISSAMGQPQLGEMEFNMYGASKSALDFMTHTFAKRWSPERRVVGIAPGWVRSAWNQNMDPDVLASIVKHQLTHKLVEPEEIANLMQTIIENPNINATVLTIDGGYSAPIIRGEKA